MSFAIKMFLKSIYFKNMNAWINCAELFLNSEFRMRQEWIYQTKFMFDYRCRTLKIFSLLVKLANDGLLNAIMLKHDSHIFMMFIHPVKNVPRIRSWWRHQMGPFAALLAICAGDSGSPPWFPAQRPVTRSFDVFFDLHLNKRLSKQWWSWWFETPSRPLWRHRNGWHDM